jgi:hypothetical protein
LVRERGRLVAARAECLRSGRSGSRGAREQFRQDDGAADFAELPRVPVEGECHVVVKPLVVTGALCPKAMPPESPDHNPAEHIRRAKRPG